MSSWKEYKLGDVAQIVDCEHRTAPIVNNSPYISVRTSDISNGKINFESANRVSEQTYVQWTKRMVPQEEDIVLAREAPVGEVGWVGNRHKVCLGQRTVLIRPNSRQIEPRYLLYYLVNRDSKNDFISQSTGSVVQHLNVKNIREFELKIFDSITKQRAIASVLSSLDEKIDLLNRQNKTLEAMAKMLFRQWFIEQADDGWDEKIITELFEIRDGTHDSPKQKETGKPLITSKHILDNKLDLENAYLISNEDFDNVNRRSKVDANDILFSMIGTIGLIYLEQSAIINYVIKNIGLFKTSQNPKWAYYTFLWLKSSYGQDFIHEHRSGSTQEYISLGSLRSIMFCIPPIDLLNKFNSIVEPLFKKITNNCNQINMLGELRDTLLPKLMSGEVRVAV